MSIQWNISPELKQRLLESKEKSDRLEPGNRCTIVNGFPRFIGAPARILNRMGEVFLVRPLGTTQELAVYFVEIEPLEDKEIED